MLCIHIQLVLVLLTPQEHLRLCYKQVGDETAELHSDMWSGEASRECFVLALVKLLGWTTAPRLLLGYWRSAAARFLILFLRLTAALRQWSRLRLAHGDLPRAAVGLLWESPNPEPPSPAISTSSFPGDGSWGDLVISLVGLPLGDGKGCPSLRGCRRTCCLLLVKCLLLVFRVVLLENVLFGKAWGKRGPNHIFLWAFSCTAKAMLCLHDSSACLCNVLAKCRFMQCLPLIQPQKGAMGTALADLQKGGRYSTGPQQQILAVWFGFGIAGGTCVVFSCSR